MHTPAVCDRLYDLRVRGKWRGMNLVKKTPVRFHWRLSTSLSYGGGETEGVDKGGGGEGGGDGARTDPRRREMFPLCIFFFFFILCPVVLLFWLVSFVKAYFFQQIRRGSSLLWVSINTHTHTKDLYFSDKQDSA